MRLSVTLCFTRAIRSVLSLSVAVSITVGFPIVKQMRVEMLRPYDEGDIGREQDGGDKQEVSHSAASFGA